MRHLRSIFLAWVLCFTQAGMADECILAFDFGSSGIRAGSVVSARPLREEIDYFHWLAETEQFAAVEPLIDVALEKILARQAAAEQAACLRLGGGFSVWRRAAERNRQALAASLRRLAQRNGLRIVVIPQVIEARYGYVGSQALLGDALQTEAVFDLGGGSLQIATAENAFGLPLGQRSWHEHLCTHLRGDPNCTLQPWREGEVIKARDILAERFAGARRVFPQSLSVTAVSRPVSRSIVPALEHWQAGVTQAGLSYDNLRQAIERWAPLDGRLLVEATGVPARFADFLLSDMLLTEAVLRVLGRAEMAYADLELTNVPGLLVDARSRQWGKRYECYLWRLAQGGEAAYFTDPASCPGEQY